METHLVQGAASALEMPRAIFAIDTNLETAEVREQLGRILASPAFQHSHRYASVLKYVVEQTLDGSGDRLKERTIGIEVFDRPPDYDTGTDHVVRSAMGEIRKRLAQYYLENGEGELRIEILPGSYIPQFRRPEEKAHPTPGIAQLPAVRTGLAVPLQDSGRAARGRWVLPFWIVAAFLILAGAVVAYRDVRRAEDPLVAFWKPLLSSSDPVLLCIGNVAGGQVTAPAVSGLSPSLSLGEFHNSPVTTVNVYDAFSLARFAALLQSRRSTFRFASQSDATFTDLQSGPAVLVGLLNNSWTERLMPKLRFTVKGTANGKVVILDRNNPSNQGWAVDYSTPYLKVTRDYALVLRIVDPETEQPLVMDAGITVFGTSAAAMFLTSPSEMKKLAAIAPPGWEKKNMEIVVATDVIQGRSGPVTILAAQFW